MLIGFGARLNHCFANVASDGEIHDKIYKQLNEGKADKDRLWPMEVYSQSKEFVYQDESGIMYKQSFDIDGDAVSFTGEPIEVERQVIYKPKTTNGDHIMRDKILAALNAANVETDGLDDDQLMTAYNEHISAQNSDSGQGITLEDVTAAVNAAVEPLQAKLNAKADAEHDAAVAKVVELDVGIDEDTAKSMSTNSLNSIIAKNSGDVAFGGGGQYQVNQQNTADDPMPE